MYIYIYAIMKIMCPSGFYHSSFMTTHAPGHMIYGFRKCSGNRASCVQVHELS